MWKFHDKDLSAVYLNYDAKIPLCIDDETCNGVINLLSKHLGVWKDVCIIRLSDILKKTPVFLEKKPQIEYNLYTHLNPVSYFNAPELTVSLRILTEVLTFQIQAGRYFRFPADHVDKPYCECRWCKGCGETW